MNPFKKLYFLFLLMIVSLVGCVSNDNAEIDSIIDSTIPKNESFIEDIHKTQTFDEEIHKNETTEIVEIIEMKSQETKPPSNIELIFVEPSAISNPENFTTETTSKNLEKKLIVIDAGHQAQGNYELEPIAPNATEQKAKVSSGTQGRFTGLPEFELTLIMAQKLEAILLDMGYQVLQVRDTHDINISNAERAIIANENNADAFIRIHANGSDDASVYGAFTICPTIHNPYCADIYEDSRLLSEYVLQEFIQATGAYERPIWETDTMSGINWCNVPVTIIEMGFMSNQEEDFKMSTDSYQDDMALGMANGIHAYITHKAQAN